MTISTTHHTATAAAPVRRAATTPRRQSLRRPSFVGRLSTLLTRRRTSRLSGHEDWHRIEFGRSRQQQVSRARSAARTPLDVFG